MKLYYNVMKIIAKKLYDMSAFLSSDQTNTRIVKIRLRLPTFAFSGLPSFVFLTRPMIFENLL